MEGQTKKQRNKRRYNLHYAIKQKGYRMDCTTREVYVPLGTKIEELHKSVRALLNEFDYSIQFELM